LSARGWNQAEAAEGLERRTAADLGSMDLPAPHECFRQIRLYLQRLTDVGGTKNGVQVLSRKELENGDAQIDAGPTIFREPCETCVQFHSGAQLSFGITLRFDGTKTTLLSYRFYLHLPAGSGLRFVRVDLNPPKQEYDSLHMPRSHIHPGFEGIHIPFPVMRPLEILDRIVHVIEPYFSP
jgi:hypothetical protein